MVALGRLETEIVEDEGEVCADRELVQNLHEKGSAITIISEGSS